MRIALKRSYTSDKGNKTFVYAVSGTESQLEEFKVAQGVHYRTDDKTQEPLWFTTRCVGNTGALIITTNGKVIADMSAFDQADSLAKQYGGSLGNELARIAAANLLGHNPSPQATPATKSTDENIDKL
jgi:hypothetical protein